MVNLNSGRNNIYVKVPNLKFWKNWCTLLYMILKAQIITVCDTLALQALVRREAVAVPVHHILGRIRSRIRTEGIRGCGRSSRRPEIGRLSGRRGRGMHAVVGCEPTAIFTQGC